MAPIPCQNAAALEAGYPSVTQEKASLVEDIETPTSSRPTHPRSVDQPKMGSVRNMFLAMLVCLLVSFGLTTAMAPAQLRAEPFHDKNGEAQAPEAAGDRPGFTSLLGAASTDSLHEILHKYFPNRYRHGVWPSEHQAMEAVHRDDAALATKIVQLAKRQDSGDNTTSTSPPPQETSTPPPVTETTSITVTETGGETTTSTIVTVSTPPPVGTTTSEPPPGSTSSDLPPTSSQPDTPTTIITSTSAPPSSTPTSPATSTSTSKSSSSESLRMITSTFTSTLSGGEVSIVTQTSFVGGNPAQSDGATSTRPDGSLQTNAAASRRNRVVEAVMGAVLGGAMLL